MVHVDAMVIDLAQGKRRQNGWVHFKCPFCPQKGRGPDPSTHLGIHTSSRGVRCWRCGTRTLPPGTVVRGWGRPVPVPLNPDAPRTVPARASWMRYTGPLPSPWSSHTPMALRAAGAIPVQTGRGGAWLLPFLDTEGYQIRYLDGGEPKVRNYAIRGPALVRQGDGPTIVVEGWADALPFEGTVYALLGTANWHRLDLRSAHGGWLLALDNDGPGKLCRDAITRACLQMGAPVAWVVYEGKDPAAAVGPMKVKDIRGLRDMRCQ